MRPNPYRRHIRFQDVFTRKLFFVNLLIYLRVLFKAIWLFFPSILFLVFGLFAFWHLAQGKDVMQRTLEQPRIFYTFIIATVVWVYITWYTSRIIGKVKFAGLSRTPGKEERFWGRFLIQMPRFLSFTCLTIIILGFLKLWYDVRNEDDWIYFTLLFFSTFYYFNIYRFWSREADRADKIKDEKEKRRFLNTYCLVVCGVLLAALLIIVFFQSFHFLVLLLIGFQAGLSMLLVFRRKYIYIKFPGTDPDQFLNSDFFERVKKFAFDKEDRAYSWGFIAVLGVGLFFYITAIFSVNFSVYIGSLSFTLFAFGILLILGNSVALASVFYRINLHIMVVMLAFIMGLIFEPHYTHTEDKKSAAGFDNRQTLNEYFSHFINKWQPELEDSSNKKIHPLIFVLADGGASRSGYWVASVMGKINEETGGKFNEHLFCMSGASGGSVGNAAYFNLLRAKQNSDTIKHDVIAVQEYLKSDFLTYTLARMLGPDVFRHIFPFPFVDNRSAALAKALEKGAPEKSLLYDSMATNFSEIITQKGQPYKLPILCINTTRMQDGLPAVVTNIDISDPRFNQRLDLLDLLKKDSADKTKEKDIKLSTAVVLGASFPYVSPAGRIDSAGTKRANYFVDGGYFDNSGSGVVNEMVNILLKDELYLKYKHKLKFFVLHITNTENKGLELKKVNPLINDLVAPIKTLMGSYGTQTAVNDNRLMNLLNFHFPGDTLYRKINLYDAAPVYNYAMNWVISKKMADNMNISLRDNTDLKKFITDLSAYFK
jgi:hypothetical protein